MGGESLGLWGCLDGVDVWEGAVWSFVLDRDGCWRRGAFGAFGVWRGRFVCFVDRGLLWCM